MLLEFVKKFFFKQYIAYSLTNFVNGICSLYLIKIYASYIPPERIGDLEYITMIYLLLQSFSILGSDNAFGYYFAETTSDIAKKIYTVNTAFIRISLSVVSLGGMCAYVYFSPYAWSVRYFLLLYFAPLPLYLIYLIGLDHSRYTFQSKKYFLLSCGYVILNMAQVVILIKYYGCGLMAVAVGKCVTDAAFFFFTFRYSLDIGFSLRGISLKFLKRIIIYGFPIYLVVLLNYMAFYIDRYYILKYFTLRDLGIYSLLVKLSQISSFFTFTFQNAWGPYSMRVYKSENAGAIFSKSFSFFMILGTYFAFIIHFFAVEIYSIFLSKTYIEYIDVLVLLNFAVLFSGTYTLANLGITLSQKTYYFTLTTFIGLSINYLTFFALSYFSVTLRSIAFCKMFAFLAQTVIAYFISKRFMRISLDYSAFLIIWLFYYIILHYFIGFNIIVKAVMAMAYAVIVYFAGVPRGDRERIFSMIRHGGAQIEK